MCGKIADMRAFKIFGVTLLALLAIGAGIFVRTAQEKGLFGFAGTADTAPRLAAPKINDAKRKQYAALTAWLAGRSPDFVERVALAHKVFSLNYTKPFPQPPYMTDTACGLYLLDSLLFTLVPQERQTFTDAYNAVFEEGEGRSVDDLFGLSQRLRPTPAAAALRELILFQIDSSLDEVTRAQVQEYFAATRYSTVLTGSPTAAQCRLIPGLPEIL